MNEDPETEAQQQELGNEPKWIVLLFLFVFATLAAVSLVAGFVVGVLENAWRKLRR